MHIQTAALRRQRKIVLASVRNLAYRQVCLSPRLFFGGRRQNNSVGFISPVDWNHGVFVVAPLWLPETTAAATGQVGVVRRDPMGNAAILWLSYGDYFAHWIEMGEILGEKAPKSLT